MDELQVTIEDYAPQPDKIPWMPLADAMSLYLQGILVTTRQTPQIAPTLLRQDFSIRLYNALTRNGIKTVEEVKDIISVAGYDYFLGRIRNLGDKSLEELRHKIT